MELFKALSTVDMSFEKNDYYIHYFFYNNYENTFSAMYYEIY